MGLTYIIYIYTYMATFLYNYVYSMKHLGGPLDRRNTYNHTAWVFIFCAACSFGFSIPRGGILAVHWTAEIHIVIHSGYLYFARRVVLVSVYQRGGILAVHCTAEIHIVIQSGYLYFARRVVLVSVYQRGQPRFDSWCYGLPKASGA